MVYEEPYWPKVLDLRSGISRLACELSAHSFEADHETVYNLSVVYDEELMQHLKQQVEIYEDGADVCSLYLQEDISLECLCYEFIRLGLENFLHSLKPFLSEDFQNKYLISATEDDSQNLTEI